MKARSLGVAALLAVCLLSACAPGASTEGFGVPGSRGALALNEGPRKDLVVERALDPMNYERNLAGLAASVWSESDALRSWFTMVDRVKDPANTVLMTVWLRSVEAPDGGGYQVPRTGTARGVVTVTVRLVDGASGIVLAEASSRRTGTVQPAVRSALADAFHRATQAYAGG